MNFGVYVFFGQRFRRNLKLLMPRCLRGEEALQVQSARGIETTTVLGCPRRGSSICNTSNSCQRTIYRSQQAQVVIQQQPLVTAGARHGSLGAGQGQGNGNGNRLTLTLNGVGVAAHLSHSPVVRIRSNTGSSSFRGGHSFREAVEEEPELLYVSASATESATVTASTSASANVSAFPGVGLAQHSSRTSCDTIASISGIHRGVNRLSSRSSYLSTASYSNSFRERESTKRMLP